MISFLLKAIFSLILVANFNLFAGVEDHLKRGFAKPNPETHSMENIDFIYTINLDRRPEKFASCLAQLQPYGINPFRFSAVNGWELTLADFNDLGYIFEAGMNPDNYWGTAYLDDTLQPQHEILSVVGRNYFSHCMSRGAIGIVLSHLSILQDALDSGYETIWIMEDDIEVIQNPNKISNLITKLDRYVGHDGWDILFTDRDTKNQKGEYVPCKAFAWKPNFTPANQERFRARRDIGSNFIKTGARYGAYSMIVRRSGMEKILNFIKTYKIFLPYDMEFYLPNDIRLYSVQEDVVSTQIKAASDNGGPNYLKNENKTE